MSRLVDADLLKENINNWYDLVNEYGQTRMTLSHDDILAKIDNMPTVDVLEQIRVEIEQSRYGLVNDGLDLALKIIDKYTK